MTPDDARKVAADMLREFGLDDEARWLEQPDAVRHLLAQTIATYNYEVAAAWRAIGHPRAAEDIENAHDEALSMLRNQYAPSRPLRRSPLDMDAANRAFRELWPPNSGGPVVDPTRYIPVTTNPYLRDGEAYMMPYPRDGEAYLMPTRPFNVEADDD